MSRSYGRQNGSRRLLTRTGCGIYWLATHTKKKNVTGSLAVFFFFLSLAFSFAPLPPSGFGDVNLKAAANGRSICTSTFILSSDIHCFFFFREVLSARYKKCRIFTTSFFFICYCFAFNKEVYIRTEPSQVLLTWTKTHMLECFSISVFIPVCVYLKLLSFI